MSAPHLQCRLRVCEAFYFAGPEAALEEVALASLDLAPLVAQGELLHHKAWDALQEVAVNLRLVDLFGQDAVQEAIAFGPRRAVLLALLAWIASAPGVSRRTKL